MMAWRVVVDVVADPPLLVPYLDELVLVEPAPEPGDPRASEPLAGQIRRVDVRIRPDGRPLNATFTRRAVKSAAASKWSLSSSGMVSWTVSCQGRFMLRETAMPGTPITIPSIAPATVPE